MNKIFIYFGIFIAAFSIFYFFPGGSENLSSGPKVGGNDDGAPLTAHSELTSILGIGDAAERNHQLEVFFTRYMQDTPIVALDNIALLERIKDRQLSYKIALQTWANVDVAALSNWLTSMVPHFEFDRALANLIHNAPGELAFYLLCAEKIFDEDARHSELKKLINHWVFITPEQTVSWAITTNQDGDRWLSSIFEVLTTDSLINAIASLSILKAGSPDQLHIAIQAIIDNYQLGQGDVDSLAAMQSVTPYEIREEFIGALLPVLVHEENLSLDDLDRLLGSLLPGAVKDSYHEQLSLSWALKDPLEAAGYAESMTGETRDLAVNAVVTSWMQNDLESADAWLKTLDGNVDLAASTLGRGSATLGNIEIADTWLNHIENGDIRTEAITDVIRDWYNEDPKAGIYHLVYQENLTRQQKLSLLHEIYPGEVFISPNEALDDIGRLEGLTPAF